MLDLRLGLNRSCDRVTRRDLLRVGSLTALGLSLPGFLQLRARAAVADPEREVSCILIWLQGGISHIDSFDPKPQAPEEIRGEFGTIATNVPGIAVCDPLPRLAQQQDKYSILRSLNPRNGSHGVADAYMMSGHPFNPVAHLSRVWRGGRQGARRPQRDASLRSTGHVRSTSGSAAAWRDFWGTSTTRSSCRAMRRARVSRSATSCCRAESTAIGFSIA